MWNELTSHAITGFHDGLLAELDWARRAAPRNTEGVWQWIESNHRYNCLLWDEEDQARRVDVGDASIAANKRAIDGFNQRRNDAIERIDESVLEELDRVPRHRDARMNSETVGNIIDRLSILSLKIFHMRLQTQRTDAGTAHVEASLVRLARLEEQRRDLADCLDRLLADCRAGTAYFKVYRQFKMYNDQALNPYLYSRKSHE